MVQTCLFCGCDVEVPPEISTPVDRSAQLQAEVKEWNTTANVYRVYTRSSKRYLWFMIGVPAITMAAVSLVFFQHVQAMHATPVQSVVIAGAAFSGAAFILGPLFAFGLAYLRVAPHCMPFAVVTITDTIHVLCPGCGGGLSVDSGIVAHCHRCDMQSLLPAPMVEKSLAKEHARAIAARDEGLGMVVGYHTAMQRGTSSVGIVYQKLAALYLFAIPSLCVLAKIGGVLENPWSEVVMIAVLTSIQVAGLAWVAGWFAKRSGLTK